MVDAVFLGVFSVVKLVVREQHLIAISKVEEFSLYNIDSTCTHIFYLIDYTSGMPSVVDQEQETKKALSCNQIRTRQILVKVPIETIHISS